MGGRGGWRCNWLGSMWGRHIQGLALPSAGRGRRSPQQGGDAGAWKHSKPQGSAAVLSPFHSASDAPGPRLLDSGASPRSTRHPRPHPDGGRSHKPSSQTGLLPAALLAPCQSRHQGSEASTLQPAFPATHGGDPPTQWGSPDSPYQASRRAPSRAGPDPTSLGLLVPSCPAWALLGWWPVPGPPSRRGHTNCGGEQTSVRRTDR